MKNKILSCFLSMMMLFTMIGSNVTITAFSAESATITFGSVDVTLTELVENDYKVTIPVSFDQNHYGLEIGGYLKNGLSFCKNNTVYYGASNKGFMGSSVYREDIDYFFVAYTNYKKTIFSAGKVAELTFKVPETAKVGDEYLIHGSTIEGKRQLSWEDSFRNSVSVSSFEDSVIRIVSEDNENFSTGFIGMGTSESPYLIQSADDLVHLSDLINNPTTNPYCRKAYYKQTADIDMSGINFKPIGCFYGSDGVTVTKNAVFSGDYNGDNHKITNLRVKSYSKYCGLFGHIGENSNDVQCKIHHLSAYGDVSSSNSIVGGIVGEISYGASVENCSFHGNVSGTDNVGGIAGNIYDGGNIEYSYFNGSISSLGIGSGIVATANIGNTKNSKSVLIDSCYSNGNIDGETVYGILGNNSVNESSAVTIKLNNCYFSSNMSSYGAPEGVVGCTKLNEVALKACADMLKNEFYEDLDNINDGYPVFEWELAPYPFKGSGTLADPYRISTKEDLFGMSRNVGVYSGYSEAHYIQTNDIDLEGELFSPIGEISNGSRICYLSGSYNGNYHNIYNLYVDANTFGGLFVGLSDGTCINLVVYGNVTSGSHCGGIVSKIQRDAIIENCAFIGDVTSIIGDAGGIVGNIFDGHDFNINNCYHNGEIKAGERGYASGIIGSISYTAESDMNVNISNCYHVNGDIENKIPERSYSMIAANRLDNNNSKSNIYINNCYITAGSASNLICPYAKIDNTTALIQSQMKQIDPDLGEAFVHNTNEKLNNAYPVFKWQLSNVQGDVNADGAFNIADVIMLQKWLLCDGPLTTWENGDLYNDNRIDAFDLCLMKQKIIHK